MFTHEVSRKKPIRKTQKQLLQEQLLGAYSIEINQAAVLLSLDNRRQCEKPIRDQFDPLELFSPLKSNFNYKRGNVE